MNLKAAFCLMLGVSLTPISALAMSSATSVAAIEPTTETDQTIPESSGLAYVDDFRLLSYNVYMLPEVLAAWNHHGRAQMIAQSDMIKGHDAVILQELFDNNPADALLNGLQAEHPHQTPVLGRTTSGWDATLGAYSNATIEDGGVAIVSRWPIEEQIQYVYKEGCGADYLSNKGFVYARINKNGENYHVIGTHAQAEDAACNYPDLPSEYLDYIFVSRDHAQPTHWHNQSLDVLTSNWAQGNYRFQELSDHYHIAGFSYADANTRTESYRAINKPYQAVQFQNKANGKFVRLDPKNNKGWLTVKGEANDPATVMSIDNWYPKNRAFCIRNDDWVQVQGAQRSGSYWNWWLGGGGGNYAYFTKPNNSSNKLRIRILNDDGDCLKNGDEIAFVDRSTVNGVDYYLQRWPSGSWKDYLYMWSKSVGNNETFTVHMGEAQKQDFTPNLRYIQ